MPAESSRAVFLSYASQDAEAARRICEALRSGGVEVWFDADGGLEHGDEWDAKIRRQVKECVLFIPVISANTQAREEGYFRIEWELAAQRAMGIASGVPFILPVVIDDTREPDALVPDRFRAVQWTRLRGGEVPPEVRARFLKLWSHRTGVLKNEAAHASTTPVHAAPSAAESIAKPGAKNYALIAAAILLVVAGAGWWLIGERNKPAASSPTPASVATVPAPKPPAAAPQSEARQLAEKARAMFDSIDGTRDDYKLAEELIAQAKAKDGTDAEVCAAEAQLHERYFQRGWDPSDARREAARAAVQRAVRLDPQSFEVRWAQASLLGYTGREGEERARQLRELRRERPTDRRILRSLGSVLDRLGRLEEAVPILDECAALPGGDPLALYTKSQAYWFVGRTAEAETAIEASIAQKPFTGALLMSVWYKTILHGDLEGARALLNRINPADLIEDRAAFFAYNVEWLARRPDAAIARVAAVPRDWLNDNWYRGPKSQLIGDAWQLAGRPEAAALEWRSALKLVEQRVATDANNSQLLYRRLELLAKLGQREEAERQFAVLMQLSGADLTRPETAPPWISECCILLGRKADAIRIVAAGLKRGTHAVEFTAADLRFNPDWDPLRGEPEFAAVIAEAERIEKAAALSGGGSGGGGAAMNPAPDAKSVVVLAFANLSDDKGNEYFSDGISEELLTVLQKIPGLHVAARTSAFSFKGKNATAQEIGTTLNVAHLVEGSVQKSGNRVKISARLSRVATGEQLWSENYTRDLADVFAVESEIAQTIVGQLRGQLTGEAAAVAKAEIQAQVQAAEKGGTKNIEAHELYLQGQFFVNQGTVESAIHAAGLLRRAVELDPQFALAWAELSGAGRIRGAFGETKQDFDEGFKLAREAADRAMVLAPDLAAVQVARANLLIGYDFDWKGAAESLQRARALAPSDPAVLAQTAQLAYAFGQADRAVELNRQAVALDPVNPFLRMQFGYALSSLKRYDEAKAEFQRIIELSPTAPWGHAGVSMILTAQGKADEAVAEAAKEAMGWSRLYDLVIAEWARGNKSASDAALAELIKSASDVAAVQIAWAYAFRHENDRAFEWLERAYRQRDGGLAWTKANFALDSLHPDPRWPAFWKKIGMTDELLK